MYEVKDKVIENNFIHLSLMSALKIAGLKRSPNAQTAYLAVTNLYCKNVHTVYPKQSRVISQSPGNLQMSSGIGEDEQ